MNFEIIDNLFQVTVLACAMLMGQACGTAAAIAAAKDIDVKQVDAKEIRASLREQNVYIPE